MPLSQQQVDDLRNIWFRVSGELVTNEEAWDMATRLLVFFDTFLDFGPSPVDNPILTESLENVIDEDGEISNSSPRHL